MEKSEAEAELVSDAIADDLAKICAIVLHFREGRKGDVACRISMTFLRRLP